MKKFVFAGIIAVAALLVGQTSTAATPLSIQVAGNHLVNGSGDTVVLKGVNFSGTQYACAEGWGFFDAPATDASVTALKSWKINAVRLPLNESCWLGINKVKPAYAGLNYQKAVGDWTKKLTDAGLYVIVDMHWNAAGTKKAMEQKAMADRDHANDYWKSVATYFKGNPAVLFDLYNEPYPDRNRGTTAAWKCVRDGGTCAGVSFTTAGSQEMLNSVRTTGAKNVVLVSGPEYAGSLNRWVEFKPNDPANQLAASVHIYGQPLGSPYDDQKRWGEVSTLAKTYPVIIGEMGDSDCSHKFIDKLMPFADTNGISYFGWGWVVADCADEPSLIKDYKGTPSNYGVGLKNHLAK